MKSKFRVIIFYDPAEVKTTNTCNCYNFRKHKLYEMQRYQRNYRISFQKAHLSGEQISASSSSATTVNDIVPYSAELTSSSSFEFLWRHNYLTFGKNNRGWTYVSIKNIVGSFFTAFGWNINYSWMKYFWRMFVFHDHMNETVLFLWSPRCKKWQYVR